MSSTRNVTVGGCKEAFSDFSVECSYYIRIPTAFIVPCWICTDLCTFFFRFCLSVIKCSHQISHVWCEFLEPRSQWHEFCSNESENTQGKKDDQKEYTPKNNQDFICSDAFAGLNDSFDTCHLHWTSPKRSYKRVCGIPTSKYGGGAAGETQNVAWFFFCIVGGFVTVVGLVLFPSTLLVFGSIRALHVRHVSVNARVLDGLAIEMRPPYIIVWMQVIDRSQRERKQIPTHTGIRPKQIRQINNSIHTTHIE